MSEMCQKIVLMGLFCSESALVRFVGNRAELVLARVPSRLAAHGLRL